MQLTKTFIITYGLFYLLIMLIGLNLNVILTTIPTNENPVTNILLFFPNAIIFVFNLFTFSTDYALVNILLWIFRAIGLIELIALIRGSPS